MGLPRLALLGWLHWDPQCPVVEVLPYEGCGFGALGDEH